MRGWAVTAELQPPVGRAWAPFLPHESAASAWRCRPGLAAELVGPRAWLWPPWPGRVCLRAGAF